MDRPYDSKISIKFLAYIPIRFMSFHTTLHCLQEKSEKNKRSVLMWPKKKFQWFERYFHFLESFAHFFAKTLKMMKNCSLAKSFWIHHSCNLFLSQRPVCPNHGLFDPDITPFKYNFTTLSLSHPALVLLKLELKLVTVVMLCWLWYWPECQHLQASGLWKITP